MSASLVGNVSGLALALLAPGTLRRFLWIQRFVNARGTLLSSASMHVEETISCVISLASARVRGYMPCLPRQLSTKEGT